MLGHTRLSCFARQKSLQNVAPEGRYEQHWPFPLLSRLISTPLPCLFLQNAASVDNGSAEGGFGRTLRVKIVMFVSDMFDYSVTPHVPHSLVFAALPVQAGVRATCSLAETSSSTISSTSSTSTALLSACSGSIRSRHALFECNEREFTPGRSLPRLLETVVAMTLTLLSSFNTVISCF